MILDHVSQVDGKLLTRNRKFLRTTMKLKSAFPNHIDIDFDSENNGKIASSVTDPPVSRDESDGVSALKRTHTRIVRPPVRYKDYVMT